MKYLVETSTTWLMPIGKRGNEYVLAINGHEYGYDMTDTNWKKFLKILQFSQGRALAWLKRNSKLVSGSTKIKESRTQEMLKYRKMSMKDFVNYRDILADPEVTPDYASFKVNKLGTFKAKCMMDVPVKDVNSKDFFKKLLKTGEIVSVPVGDYEIIENTFDDAYDDFIIGFISYDKTTKMTTCFSVLSKEFERQNSVTITSYVEIR